MTDRGQSLHTMHGEASGAASREGTLHAGRLWIGAALAAVVAGLVAAVCLLVSRGIFGVRIFLQAGTEPLFEATMGTFALVVAGVTLLAVGLIHLLMVAAPEPRRFFTWITGLLVTASVLAPFATGLPLSSQIASALTNLVVGWSIVALVRFVAKAATLQECRSEGAAQRGGTKETGTVVP